MELSNWDETSCSLLCQHPCCWSSVNRIERRVPRKNTPIVKLNALDYQSSRDEEDNKEKTEGKRRKEGHVCYEGAIITSPTVCNLLKSFPNCSEPLTSLDVNSERGQHKCGLFTDIDSQKSLRFDVPKCPPVSEERVTIQSSKEEKVPCVHTVRAFIINCNSDSVCKPPYIWVPAKKKETKQNVFSGGQRPSTQIFEASQVLECNKKTRKKSVSNMSDEWSAWMSSSKFRFKSNKCRYKPLTGFERQKAISSDLEFNFCLGNLDQQVSKYLVNKRSGKGDLLQTRGLSADSRFFWKPTSVIESATNKNCPFNLESSQASLSNDILSNKTYNLQKQSKIEFGVKNNESVEIPSSEIPHGKLATISLELGSKHNCPPLTQPMNYQKKGVDISLVPISSPTGNLPMQIKELKEHLNNAATKEVKKKDIKDESGTNCGHKNEDTAVAKDRRRQKKERIENMTKCTSYQAAPNISSIETVDSFDPPNSCFAEAMPLHRVRITSPPAKLNWGQSCCPGKKKHGSVSDKRRPSMAAMTSLQRVRVTSSQLSEQPEAIITQKSMRNNDPTDKVDFPDLPKPPPPSPQMFSNINSGPSPHQLFSSSRSESLLLQEKNANKFLPKKQLRIGDNHSLSLSTE